jgi:hypothetical protein
MTKDTSKLRVSDSDFSSATFANWVVGGSPRLNKITVSFYDSPAAQRRVQFYRGPYPRHGAGRPPLPLSRGSNRGALPMAPVLAAVVGLFGGWHGAPWLFVATGLIGLAAISGRLILLRQVALCRRGIDRPRLGADHPQAGGKAGVQMNYSSCLISV